MPIFEKPDEYAAFERVLEEAVERTKTRLLAYCVELSALRRSLNRGYPFGEAFWSDRIVRRLGLQSTLRPRGRPKKQENDS